MNIAAPIKADVKLIALDLPMPPSVNRIWRARETGGRPVFLSTKYRNWKQEAETLALQLGQCRGVKRIDGPFQAHIVLQHRRGDLDNRVKAVLDIAQEWELIKNDSNCVRLLVEYGEAPYGCRLILGAVDA